MADFRKSTLREYFESIVIAVILALFIRTFVVQAFKIPTGSMEENLLIGDHLLVNKFIFGPTASPTERLLMPIGTIARGNIVVFKYPEEPDRDFIKRVIGLPGETVEVRTGYVFVNGQRLEEPYVNPSYRSRSNDFPAATVPPGSYFVMGDHRDRSSDSRVWGFVPRELIKGRALLIWWSYMEGPNDINLRGVDQLKAIGSKVAHLFTRSRWSRCFTLIR